MSSIISNGFGLARIEFSLVGFLFLNVCYKSLKSDFFNYLNDEILLHIIYQVVSGVLLV